MHTITKWIERKLGLKVNATKTKVTKPSKLKYLGFGFVKMGDKWECRPHKGSLEKFKRKLKALTKRSWSVSMDTRIQRLNWVIRGWINYFRIGKMRQNMTKIDMHLRNRMRIVICPNNFPTFNRYMLRTRYGIAPMSYGELDKSRVIRYSDPDEVNMKKVLTDIHRDSQTPINMASYVVIQTLEEMLYLEFMEMLKRGIRIKCCALCDKYFVLADKRKREYCDRVYKGDRTCKQIGAKLKFNKSVEEDIYLQQFQTIYNRMYSRYYRIDAWDSDRETNKITEEEFRNWSSHASQLRLDYKAGKLDGEELVKALEYSTKFYDNES